MEEGMNNVSCPYCGAAARLLFNLVACLTPGCRNYDVKFQKEWSQHNRPHYRHNEYWGYNHVFLGNFTSKQQIVFDLYRCKTNDGITELALARFGDDDSECFYVDFKQTEVGTVAAGPVGSVNPCVERALKEALKRSKRK
jgi:hypothetical protein